MDIFAHSVWTNIVFFKKYKNERKNRFIAVLFGILPDLVSFSPVFVYSFFVRVDFIDLIGSNIWIVRYASESYKYTHSVVVFFLVCILVVLIRKYVIKVPNYESLIYWPMFGSALHILIDIFTHKGFYETPFLFPIFDYKFSYGISWAHPMFMIVNYGALAAVYLFWFLVLRKQK